MAGLEGVRLHDLRHTHASFGVGGGLGLPVIAKLLGHAQIRTTERYSHLDADPIRALREHRQAHPGCDGRGGRERASTSQEAMSRWVHSCQEGQEDLSRKIRATGALPD